MDDHTTLTYLILESSPLATRTVTVVPLPEFLSRYRQDLGVLLDDLEPVLRTQVPAHAPTPEVLRFSRTAGAGVGTRDPSDLVDAFTHAIRINPDYRPRAFLKLLPDGVFPPDRSLDFTEIATHQYPGSNARYRSLDAGETVSALDVIATAADEPDYGMDMGLFADSGTDRGRIYGFGRQPFGNPENPFSTQAPFHMAFLHESPILHRLSPETRRSLISMRVLQFSALAGFAFERKCDYWGFRFAGWALHYVQDLTMPYHARALPGWGTASILFRGVLRALGVLRPYEEMIRRVTARHMLLEEILFEYITAACKEGRRNDPYLRALRGDPARVVPAHADPARTEDSLPRRDPIVSREFHPRDLAGDVSRRAAALAPAADRALARRETDPTALQPVLTAILEETGRWTRAFTSWCTRLQPGGLDPAARTPPPR